MKILVTAVKTLQSSLRLSDSIGRWCGEGFILLAAVDKVFLEKQEMPQLFKRIRLRIKDQGVPHGEHSIAITTTTGVTYVTNKASIKEISHAADMALYQAKNEGRNQICCGLPVLTLTAAHA